MLKRGLVPSPDEPLDTRKEEMLLLEGPEFNRKFLFLQRVAGKNPRPARRRLHVTIRLFPQVQIRSLGLGPGISTGARGISRVVKRPAGHPSGVRPQTHGQTGTGTPVRPASHRRQRPALSILRCDSVDYVDSPGAVRIYHKLPDTGVGICTRFVGQLCRLAGVQ
jgi:hypothetical protein